MTDSLETKLHNFLKAQGGKHIDYEQIKYLVEKVWLTPKGGHYRMETLTRRWRKDKYKTVDISDRIGKDYKNNAIVALYYKTDSLMPSQTPKIAQYREFCCIEYWRGQAHNKKCFKTKL